MYKLKNNIYYIYYKQPDGSENRISTRTKIKKEAEKFYEQFVANRATVQKPIVQEIYREQSTIEPITLGKFKERFLEYSKAFHSTKTLRDYITTFNNLFTVISPSTYLSQIKLKEINSFIEQRMTKTIHGARRDVINLKSIFNKAVSEGYLVSNPCAQLKRIKIPERLPLFFSKEDFSKLLSVIDEIDIYEMVIFAAFTGMRQMEVIQLTWSQVNLTSKNVILDNETHITKSKKIRTVPLNVSLIEILNRRKNQAVNEFVFTYKGKKIKADYLQDSFRKYIKKAEVNPRLHFHSLRHTFASWLVQSGVPIIHVSKLLGHADISTTMIYSHLSSSDLSMAVETLNQVF